MISDYYKPVYLVQRPIRTGDGGGSFTTNWSNHLTISGRMKTLTGNERVHLDKEIVEASHKLFTAPAQDILETDRIIEGARIFDIKFISNPMDMNHHLEIYLLEKR